MARLRPLALGFALGVVLATLGRAGAQAPTPPPTPRNVEPDGGRATAVHRIPLYHEEKAKIGLADDPLLPFSTRVTCGQCHDYATIRAGWHFNAADPSVPPGRPGEPWILFDRVTGTQLPLSYRRWPGTFRPEAVGLTPWLFTRAFGGHLAGGGVSEPEDPAAEPGARWYVTGKLEINCLHCHHADPAQNGSEWAVQVSRQNFRWAAAAASDLAVVQGSAARAPDSFDPFMESNAQTQGPRTRYDPARFNARGEVFFDVVRRPDPSRCYFCHSGREVGPAAPEKWQTGADVHLAGGMRCTDCHRNGLDHRIVRGYEGEAAATGNPMAATFTCRGCHLGPPGEEGGRFSAPRPEHRGLPPVHLEKLSCTACHSGPWPRAQAYRTQTSASHRMGVHGGYRGEDAAPYLYAPVFRRDARGVIAPHKVMWPSFWGTMDEETVSPISPFTVREVAGAVLESEATTTDEAGESAAADEAREPARPLTRETVRAVLEKLAAARTGPGRPVLVTGGRLYRLAAGGRSLEGVEHAAARPYAWPLAHDVRPAARSLGASGCEDCHAAGAPFHFGRVTARTPEAFEPPVERAMHEFQDLDPGYLEALAASIRGRSIFTWVGFGAAAVVALILFLYLLRGLERLLGWRRIG